MNLIVDQGHYTSNGIHEPIKIMKDTFSQEEFCGFLNGNVLKYMLRYKEKNGIEDLRKAQTYLTWLIDEYQEEENGATGTYQFDF